MIKFEVGPKGSGKSKKIIAEVNAAVASEKGNVVFVSRDGNLTHDVDRAVRLVDTKVFNIKGFEQFGGFLSGIIARDYDTTHIFIDSVFKSVGDAEMADLDGFVPVLEKLEQDFGVSFTIMVTADADSATANVKKYTV